MAEGDETPRPRRALGPRETTDDAPPTRGRRAAWPEDWDHEEPTPVSRRAWREPAVGQSTEIQQVSQPARGVDISHAAPSESAAAESAEDTQVRGIPPVPPMEPTPTAAMPRPTESDATTADSPTAPTAPSAGEPTSGSPELSAGMPAATESSPFARPTDAAAEAHPPMPTLQPPSYTKQPSPAPQEKATSSTKDLTTKAARRNQARGAKRAADGHLQEWDAAPSGKLDKRTRLSLLGAGIAGLVIVALAVGFAVISGRDSQVATPPGDDSTVTRPPEQYPSERMLLTAEGAHTIGARDWTVKLTQDWMTDDSPRPSCIAMTVDGQPVPHATMLRTLEQNGSEATALHTVDTYASAEEASQVYANRATQLGACDREPTLITGGFTVSDTGDEAVGITTEVQDDQGIRHTVVLSRTGSAVNIIDVAQPDQPASMAETVQAMSTVVDSQCTAAVGLCSLQPAVAEAPPPPSGGDPGFLTSSDIPRITSGAGSWSANPATTDVDIVGSQCEGVSSWGSVSGADESRMATFLLLDDAASPNAFGLDQVVLTMESKDAASDFVDEVNSSMEDCANRLLTAEVSDPVDIEGPGAAGTEIKGYTYEVTQKASSGELQYRVGIVSVDTKVAYVVLPVDGEFDFTDDQWEGLAQRAGERASQIR